MKKQAAHEELETPETPIEISESPVGWVMTRMGEIAEVVGGGTPKASDPENFSDDGHPWITPADLGDFSGTYIQRGRRSLSEQGLRHSSAQLMPRGAVLMSSRAPIGYVAIAGNEISTNQGFKSFVLHRDILPEYVFYWLKFLKPYLEQFGSGSTFAEISGSRAREIPISIAPLAEQKRIVAKIEELLARINATRERLGKVPTILKRFRQAVLAAACSGRLTGDWREACKLGEKWRSISLKEVATEFSYGSSAKSSATGKIPVLRMGNIQDGRLTWDDLVFTSNAEETKKYRLVPGDVLFNRTNSSELVGKTAVYNGERPAIYAGYLIRVQCGKDLLPDYLNYCLNSPAGRDFCWSVKSDAVSQSNINAKKLAAFELELPTVPEQQEIVRRVESLLKLADTIQKRVAAAKRISEILANSILSKAFRGELVPTEAELARRENRAYEPAGEITRSCKHSGQLLKTKTR